MDGKTNKQGSVQAYEMVHREEVGTKWEARIVAPDYSIDHAEIIAEIIEGECFLKNRLNYT